jgi:hypothetical protein
MPDSRLDELYRGPPDRFVAARDQLAKDMRSAGESEEAARVKKLRRPTVAAWIINRAALEAGDQVEEFAAASGALEQAQRRAVEGGDEGASEWRAAAAREREAIAGVLAVAERLARDAGQGPSGKAMELVEETLRAAAADADLRSRVVEGRVEREQSAATLGTLGAVAAPKRRRTPAKARTASAAERRELARVERALEKAAKLEEEREAQVERAQEAVREAKERLSAAKRERADLERRRRKARR